MGYDDLHGQLAIELGDTWGCFAGMFNPNVSVAFLFYNLLLGKNAMALVQEALEKCAGKVGHPYPNTDTNSNPKHKAQIRVFGAIWRTQFNPTQHDISDSLQDICGLYCALGATLSRASIPDPNAHNPHTNKPNNYPHHRTAEEGTRQVYR
jgi:hypothetical protein